MGITNKTFCSPFIPFNCQNILFVGNKGRYLRRVSGTAQARGSIKNKNIRLMGAPDIIGVFGILTIFTVFGV